MLYIVHESCKILVHKLPNSGDPLSHHPSQSVHLANRSISIHFFYSNNEKHLSLLNPHNNQPHGAPLRGARIRAVRTNPNNRLKVRLRAPKPQSSTPKRLPRIMARQSRRRSPPLRPIPPYETMASNSHQTTRHGLRHAPRDGPLPGPRSHIRRNGRLPRIRLPRFPPPGNARRHRPS